MYYLYSDGPLKVGLVAQTQDAKLVMKMLVLMKKTGVNGHISFQREKRK